MKRPPRPVVIVTVAGRLARLTVAANGSGYTLRDVVELARVAGIDARSARGAVLVPVRSLPDLEALARLRSVVIHRRRPREALATVAPEVAGSVVDDGPEPVHACARDACRVPRCGWKAAAS